MDFKVQFLEYKGSLFVSVNDIIKLLGLEKQLSKHNEVLKKLKEAVKEFDEQN
jgi:CII-binding regulator of phage lambda lysogenization HflD